MSIKESLEAFVAHVKSLEDEDEGGDDGYTKDFQVSVNSAASLSVSVSVSVSL